MHGVNLIPAPRRHAKQRLARIRWVAAACAVYCVLLLGGYGFAYVAWGADVDAVQGDLQTVNGAIKKDERALTSVRAELKTVESTLAANRAVGSQPDWSVLLALLAKRTGENVVLNSCELDRAASEDEKPDHTVPAAQASYRLAISGIAKSQMNVSQFVLRLEKTQLFDQVTLLDTTRQSVADRQVVAFNLDCLLGPGQVKAK